jgi:hypothetical protein
MTGGRVAHPDSDPLRALDGAQHNRLPMDWRRFIDNGPAFPLYIDVFDLSERPRLAGTSTIDFRQLEGRPCRAAAAQVATDTTPDCKLLALTQRLGPRCGPRPSR